MFRSFARAKRHFTNSHAKVLCCFFFSIRCDYKLLGRTLFSSDLSMLFSKHRNDLFFFSLVHFIPPERPYIYRRIACKMSCQLKSVNQLFNEHFGAPLFRRPIAHAHIFQNSNFLFRRNTLRIEQFVKIELSFFSLLFFFQINNNKINESVEFRPHNSAHIL